MLSRLIVITVLLLTSIPVNAAITWDVEQLFERMAARSENVDAEFQEITHVRNFKKPLRTSGTFRFAVPNIVEKHITLPQEERLLIDESGIKLIKKEKRGYHIEDATSAIEATKAAFATAIYGLMTGNKSAISSMYNMTLEGRESFWTLKLTPLEAKSLPNIKLITITGSNISPESIIINKNNGDYSEMNVTY